MTKQNREVKGSFGAHAELGLGGWQKESIPKAETEKWLPVIGLMG